MYLFDQDLFYFGVSATFITLLECSRLLLVRMKVKSSLIWPKVYWYLVAGLLFLAVAVAILSVSMYLKKFTFLPHLTVQYFGMGFLGIGIGVLVALMLRWMTHERPLFRHPPGMERDKYYFYELQRDGLNLYSLHFGTARIQFRKGRFGLKRTWCAFRRSDVSLKHDPFSVLSPLLTSLEPGTSILLATPDKALYEAVVAVLPQLEAKHSFFKVPVDDQMNWLMAWFGNWLNNWGYTDFKAVRLKGYLITKR